MTSDWGGPCRGLWRRFPVKRLAVTRCLARCLLAGMLIGWWSGPATAQAQGYPNKPLHFIVPYPPGGGSDITARIIAPKLSERLGQPVIVENRPGGGGIVGVNTIAKAAPDGYTIGQGPSGLLTLSVTLQPKLPYSPIRDFAPITMAVNNLLILVAHPSFSAKDVGELIAVAKAKPGQLSFGSSGTGTAMHLAGVLLTMMAGIDMVHIPYKGSSPSANDLMGGQIPLAIIDLASIRSFIKAGKIKPLGTMGPTRSQLAPDIPTIAESGLPGFVAQSWWGIIAPARTPPEIVARLNSQLVAILENADTRERLLAGGVEPSPSSPEEFSEFIRSEISRWAKVIKDAKIEAD